MRLSSSLPGVFKALRIPGRLIGKEEDQKFLIYDGAIGGLNYALNLFENEKTDGEPLSVIFDSIGYGRKIILGKPNSLSKSIRRFVSLFGLVSRSRIDDMCRQEREDAAKRTRQMFILPHGERGVLNFATTKSEMEAIQNQVQWRVEAWWCSKKQGKNWLERLWPTKKEIEQCNKDNDDSEVTS
jgi:predicted acylesterase/phospholipase RssA